MTIPATSRVSPIYQGNASATVFAFSYKTYAKQELQVIVSDGITPQTLVLDSDYSVALNLDQINTPGGSVTYPISGSPLAVGRTLVVVSAVPNQQDLSLPTGGAFNAASVELGFDRQEVQLQQFNDTLNRTIRVPVGESISAPLPAALTRANYILGFDGLGNPVAVVPVSGSAASLATDLTSTSVATKGAGQVGLNPALPYASGTVGELLAGVGRVVSTITALKALVKTGVGKAFVLGYYAAGDGGGGQYYYDSADTSTADNGGTVIVASDGGRWKLILTGPVSVKQFGAKGDFNGTTGTDDTAAIQACITWVQANTNTGTYNSYSPSVGTGVVYFPQGSYKTTAALVIGTKICVLGEGQTEYSYGSRLTQTTAGADIFSFSASAGSTSFSVEKMVLRYNTASGAGNGVNTQRTGGGQINSQRYIDCTFSQSAGMSLILCGDDIVLKNCLFDVSTVSGNCVQLGTASIAATNVRIEGCNFFNVTNSCIRLTNVVGLTVIGNTMTQPNGSTKTPYFIDGQVATPTAAQDITVCGNTARGARTFVGISGAVNLTVTGNTVAEGGIGAGETLHLLQFGGACVNVAITGNTFRGSYDTKNFYNDFNCSSITGVISGNSFQNDGGAGDALACTKHAGRICSNQYAGFSARQMGEKRATSGAPVSPGSITTLSLFGYVLTVPSALPGDVVNFGTISNAWIAQPGIEVRGFVSAANTVRIEYRNSTAGSITVAAHDIWCEVTR